MTGILRHDPDWINTIGQFDAPNFEKSEKRTLLLISRGHSGPDGYLPRLRKVEYLKDVLEFAQKFELKIVVKPHPKERDLSIYREVFGEESGEGIWECSDSHLFQLAKSAIMAVSFFSGCAIDLTAAEVPTVERLNLIGLKQFDNDYADRDLSGDPVFQYRRDGHVIGSSSSSEFKKAAEDCYLNPEGSLARLKQSYKEKFLTPVMKPRTLAETIYKSHFETA